MSYLQCSASTCANNNSGTCCRPNIKVKGVSAFDPSGTSCGSYVEVTSGFSNSTQYDVPNLSLDIHCEADNCIYNHTKNCTADSIQIDYGSADTECSTFQNGKS